MQKRKTVPARKRERPLLGKAPRHLRRPRNRRSSGLVFIDDYPNYNSVPECIRCEEEREREGKRGENEHCESPENSLGSEFRSARGPFARLDENAVLEEDGRCSATRARAAFRASLIVETFRDGFYPSVRVGRVIKSSAKVRRTPNALRKIIKRSS